MDKKVKGVKEENILLSLVKRQLQQVLISFNHKEYNGFVWYNIEVKQKCKK